MLEDGWARISIEPKLEVIWVEHLVPLTREQGELASLHGGGDGLRGEGYREPPAADGIGPWLDRIRQDLGVPDARVLADVIEKETRKVAREIAYRIASKLAGRVGRRILNQEQDWEAALGGVAPQEGEEGWDTRILRATGKYVNSIGRPAGQGPSQVHRLPLGGEDPLRGDPEAARGLGSSSGPRCGRQRPDGPPGLTGGPSGGSVKMRPGEAHPGDPEADPARLTGTP